MSAKFVSQTMSLEKNFDSKLSKHKDHEVFKEQLFNEKNRIEVNKDQQNDWIGKRILHCMVIILIYASPHTRWSTGSRAMFFLKILKVT
jgi:uncharacterized ion transporter superfamily protein YfcC